MHNKILRAITAVFVELTEFMIYYEVMPAEKAEKWKMCVKHFKILVWLQKYELS